MQKEKALFSRRIVLSGTALFLALTLNDLFQIAWGTGQLAGGFSATWGILFAFSFFALFFYFLLLRGILFGKIDLPTQLASIRSKAPLLRYLLILLLLVGVLYFFRYTLWGWVFTGLFFRIFIWLNLLLMIAILLTKSDEKWLSWQAILTGTILTSAAFTLASAFSNVTNYPFNLYWSDGNRIWDYSIMFGRDIYNYPADKPIEAFISSGRQFLWGLPFLFPNTSILFNRFWSAFVLTFPYMALGWVAFKIKETKVSTAFLLALWTFLFLNQGPIYTPLVLSAILVTLVWESPLWIALPVVALAGNYAEITRYTWQFAPSIWAAMLFLNGTKLKGERIAFHDWVRAALLVISGILFWLLKGIFPTLSDNLPLLFVAAFLVIVGLLLLEKVISMVDWSRALSASSKKVVWGLLAGFLLIVLIYSRRLAELVINFGGGFWATVKSSMGLQPLLWSRLLPNDTYPEGILGGLLIAILPLIIFFIHLLKKKYWQPSPWQKWILVGALLPFLAVGIIASTKIGGGNNLHNLDMFLIAVLFIAAIAWRNGGAAWFSQKEENGAGWIKALLVLLIALPAYAPLQGLRPKISLTDLQVEQIKILADVESVESLPNQAQINDALWYIRHKINDAQEMDGDILFIDQRQLLTFGYVPQVPLVPEYEKKRMMNEAMSSNAAYFAPYYEDLAAQRFSLIITEPLKVEFKEEEGVFAAENDLWAKWVAAPTLCYYEPLETLWDVYIQLLVPRQEPMDCTPYLP